MVIECLMLEGPMESCSKDSSAILGLTVNLVLPFIAMVSVYLSDKRVRPFLKLSGDCADLPNMKTV